MGLEKEQRTVPDQVTLSGGFGSVTVHTRSGQLTDLRLRNPDGSLSAQALTGGPIGTSVVAENGTRYESQYGTPDSVEVRRNGRDEVESVELKGVHLGPSPVLTPVEVGAQPTSVIFSRDGETAYVTNFAGNSLTPFDPVSGKTFDPIALGGSPTGILEAPNGHLFVSVCLAPCKSTLSWARTGVPLKDETGKGELVEVDPQSRSVLARIPVGKEPQFPAITPDGGKVLVPNHGSDSVSVVDTASASVSSTIEVGPGPVTVVMAPEGKRAYVTNLGMWHTPNRPRPGDDTLTPIDVDAETALPAITVGPGPFGAAVTPDGTKVVVSLNRGQALVTVDTDTGAVSQPIDLGVFPKGGAPQALALSPDGVTAYVLVMVRNSSDATHALVPVNLGDRRVLAPLPPSVPDKAHTDPRLLANGVAVSPDGETVLAVNWPLGSVSRYDLDPPPGPPAPLVEDWTLSAPDEGKRLRWTIAQRWSKDFSGSDQSQPTIQLLPDVVSTLWYDPDKILSRTPSTPANTSSVDRFQTLDDKNTWAVYKLWSAYRFQSDLRLDVMGGYLTKSVSGSQAVAQAGARFDRGDSFQVKAGTRRSLTLDISPSDKRETGYQLEASVPDREMLDSLTDLYASLLNGGAVADQGQFWWGNNVGGPLLAYEAFDSGAALNVGVPGRKPAAERDHSIVAAFRGYLEDVLKAVDDQGKVLFGFSSAAGGIDLDHGLYVLLGLHQYTVHTGDLSLFREYRSEVERALAFWTGRIAANGLVATPGAEAEYHDIVWFGRIYYSTYINSFLYGALGRVAELERALAGRASASGDEAMARAARAAASRYDETAAELRDAINEVMWTPDSPHGPMYADWIDADTGEKQFYFMDAAQWPAIAFGVADREQARQIIVTADARIAELTAEHGYRGTGTLVTLWPLPPDRINYELWPFGVYMNGGMLLRFTYFEVMARAFAGDADGAYERLAGFARGYRATAWYGDNSATISGAPEGGSRESYLADMMPVPASLIQGILGINATWDELKVDPALPSGWDRAQASIIYLGERYCVSIHGKHVEISRGACK